MLGRKVLVGLLLCCLCCCAQGSSMHAASHRFKRLKAPPKPNLVLSGPPVLRDRLALAPGAARSEQAPARFTKPYNVCTSDWSPMVRCTTNFRGIKHQDEQLRRQSSVPSCCCLKTIVQPSTGTSTCSNPNSCSRQTQLIHLQLRL
jgi:hypothetical protein